jgi:hypothetical protein
MEVRMAGPESQRGVPGDRPDSLIRLVNRLITSQAAATGAIGLFFTRRHLATVLVTLAIVLVLCGLALVVRTGSHAAWVAALSVEGAFVLVALLRFVTTGYVGGTLFAIITIGVLVHPGVARAFASGPQPGGEALGENPLGEPGRG